MSCFGISPLTVYIEFHFIQPAFFVAVFATKENIDIQLSNAGGGKLSTIEVSSEPVESTSASLVDTILGYAVNSDSLINKYVLIETSSFFFR